MFNFLTTSLSSLNVGVSRSYSDSAPAHYSQKIQSVSLLQKHSGDGYESAEFAAGGYKWKLVLYPNGKKKNNVRGYISTYLKLARPDSLQDGWEVSVDFRVFLLDQNRGVYLVLQDSSMKQRCFHGAMIEAGIDELFSRKEFTNASNGYLVDNTFVIGAEVFVCRERRAPKAECISMVSDPYMHKYVWKLDNFSKLSGKEHIESEPFTAGNQKWNLWLYPEGHEDGCANHISLSVGLADPKALPTGLKFCATISLRIVNQMHPNKPSKAVEAIETDQWFSASNSDWGWKRFIALETFRQAKKGFLVKDTCLIEVEVTVHGNAKVL